MRTRTTVGLGSVGALLLATLVAALAPGSAVAGAAGQAGRVDFAPAGQADIHPGIVTDTKGGECTANFIFSSGGDLFIGQAAHCAGKGPATATNGCNAAVRPLGTEVKLKGTGVTGTLAYSSWSAMQRLDEDDPSLCQFNDFALVKIPNSAQDRVNPTVPGLGGPTGVAGDVPRGETVYSYGNSPLRVGPLGQFDVKIGKNLTNQGDDRTHVVLTLSPGVPGDSGSGFLDSQGRAFGVLSTLALVPVPGSNGVTDLSKALNYANAHSKNIDGPIELVEGTEPFGAPSLPLKAVAGLF